MNPNPYIKQYQKNQIETATPEKILIMLYDGAIQYLNVVKATMNEPRNAENIQKVHNNMIGAQRIITEFMNTLDMEVGGEVAQNLYDLYNYLYNRLVEANIKKDVSMVEEVLAHIKELKETWVQAINISQKEKVQSKNHSVSHISIAGDDDEEEEDYYEKSETEA